MDRRGDGEGRQHDGSVAAFRQQELRSNGGQSGETLSWAGVHFLDLARMRFQRSPSALRSHVLIATLATVSVAASACSAPPPAAVQVVIAHELWAGFYPIDAATLEQSSTLTLQTVVREDSHGLFADFAGGAYSGVAASLVDLLRLKQVVPGLVIVGCTDESAGADAVVAAPSVPTIAALRGRRIGVMRGTFSEMVVRRMLLSEGLSIRDVQLVDVDAPSAPRALREGKVDAVATWEPYLSEVGPPEFRRLFSTAESPGLVLQCLALRQELVREHPAAVREMVARIVSAGTAGVPTPDSLRYRAARALGRDLVTMPAVQGLRWLSLEENRRLLGASGPAQLEQMAAEHVRFLAESGILRSPPDIATMVTPAFLPP